MSLNAADELSIAFEIQQRIVAPKAALGLEVGAAFCAKCFPAETPRSVLKQIRFDRAGLQLIEFLIGGSYVLTTPITVYSNNGKARCTVRLVHSPGAEDLNCSPMFMRELRGVLNEYAVIDGLESMSYAAGRLLLRNVLKLLGDTPVVIQAGYLYYGDYDTEELRQLPEKLASFYEEEGFVNVNDWLCHYEDCIIMIHCTDETMKMLEAVYRDEQA